MMLNGIKGMEKFLFKTIEFLRVLYSRFGFSITRPMTLFVKTNCKGYLTGVEIGVFKGDNAKNIIQNLKMDALYLIDPYVKYSEFHDFVNRPIDDDLFNEVKQKFKKYKETVKFIRNLSSDVVDDIPDNLDFVYIDGNHDYEFVKRDIELYYPKVKNGGVVGGHNFDVKYNGVCKAVIEFAQKNNLNICGSAHYIDWWFKK